MAKPKDDLICKQCNQQCATDVTGTAYCVLCGKARYRIDVNYGVPYVEIETASESNSKIAS